MQSRREFLGRAAIVAAFIALGAIGGCTDKREPRRHEPDDGGEEPP